MPRFALGVVKVTALVVFAGVARLGAACPDFALPVTLTAGQSPHAAAAADFNGDGRPDLAVVNMQASNFSVYLATGNGTFAAPVTYTTPTVPTGVAAGDFDRDGRIDLVIASSAHDNVTFFGGNGGGTFTAGASYPAHSGPTFVLAADFDRDGRLDVAVANGTSNDVSVLLGNGAGGFGGASDFSVDSNPVSITAADFNGDGRLDLATANFTSNSVSVLIATTFGGFGAAASIAVPATPPAATAGPRSIVAGDFDLDGNADLAVADETSDAVTVFAGDGSGGFAIPATFAAGDAPRALVVADFNGDGTIDLAAADYNSGHVTILSGDGNGGFTTAASLPSAVTTSALAVADFSRDGKPDLASANEVPNVTVYLNSGDCLVNCGTFTAGGSLGTGLTPDAVAPGDFDRDGNVDLAVANSGSGTVSIFLASGGGAFNSPSTAFVGSTPSSIAVADFNRDGSLDLVVGNSGSGNLTLLQGSASGSFSGAGTGGVGITPEFVATGDFNRDGYPDLAVADSSSNAVWILTGTSSFNFSSPTEFFVQNAPKSIAVGDFNGDGSLDLAVANSGSATVSILVGDGSGGFTTGTTPGTGNTPVSVSTADFDGDGRLDLAVANRGENDVTVLMGNGSGGFSTPSGPLSVGSTPTSVTAADFTRDGYVDLAVVNSGSNTFSLLRGNGDGTFAAAVGSGVGSNPLAAAAADLDHDGSVDLVTADSFSSSVSILLNSCPRPDLAIQKSHSGSFSQGQTGASYTITVSNMASAAPSGGTVTVTDTLPAGLTATAIGGSGWTCTLQPLACSRSDSLGAGSGYPAINVWVDVSATAPSLVTNSATVSGGGDATPGNNTATDLTSVTQLPDLTVTKTHTGNFNQGQAGVYTITVHNAGGAPTSGTVLVTDSLPAGMTATGLSGSTWACSVAGRSCTNANSLPAGGSYPAITLTVTVAPNAASQLTNNVAVSGGGETYATNNNTASDLTQINLLPDLVVTKTHTGNFRQGQTGAVYTITVSNNGGASTSGTVTVADTLPAPLTATSISGTGWNCPGGLTCTRSNALPPGGTYPAITLTVSVAANAPTSVTNNVSVSGGGETFTGNDSAADVTPVNGASDMTLVKSHTGSFKQGQNFRSYTLTVTNSGTGPTTDVVTVTDVLPAGLTLSTIGGTGWTCLQPLARCSRADVLAASSSYPPIKVTVNVDDAAPASVTNAAAVSGGGELNATNNAASDPTTVVAVTDNCGRFQPASNFAAGSHSLSAAVGDFNGDGNADLATIGTGNLSDQVFILIGAGDGTFGAPASYAVGTSAVTIVSADLNGDGKADLVITNSNSSNVSVLLGNGNGTFANAVNYGTATLPYGLVVADFNGDGKPDVATASPTYPDGSLSVLLGTGSGTFSAAMTTTILRYSTALAAADFDDDGNLDLAIASQYGSVSILSGNGDGTFGVPTLYSIGSDARSIALGDFNRDGRLDLAIANLSSEDVSVLRGNAGGTFGTATSVPTGPGTFSILTRDLDHDGLLDLAVSNAAGVAVLDGNGNGTFAAPVVYAAATSPEKAVVGDFNGDGKPDLVVVNQGSSNVSVLLSACADLTVTKTHSGNFTQGQTGATYTVTVANAGPVATSGVVTLTDTLPAGLTAVSISGSGWSCTQAALRCTRSDDLLPAIAYPPVTVTVNVNSNAPANVTNTASVTAVAETVKANNSASDPATVSASGLIAPTNLVATIGSTTSVDVVWDAVTTAVQYQVFRRSAGTGFTLAGTAATPSFADAGRTPGTAYVYQVKAVNAASTVGPASNSDIATTITFTDDPLVARTTMVKAIHMDELRTAVNAVRATAGLAAAVFTDGALPGVPVRAVHVTELRAALDPARSALGLPAVAYADPSIAAGAFIEAGHMQEIRNSMK